MVKKGWFPVSIFFLAGPLFVAMHEGAHFLVARLLGLNARFGVMQVMVEASSPHFRISSRAAGPGVDLIVALAGLCWLRSRRRHREEDTFSKGDWLAALLMMPLVRCLLLIVPILLRGFTQRKFDNDEQIVAVLLGIPWWLLSTVLFVISLGMAVALYSKFRKARQVRMLVAVGLIYVFGIYFWVGQVSRILVVRIRQQRYEHKIQNRTDAPPPPAPHA